MKTKNGFTIVEVLVVIAIIAILTIIVFPSITQIRAKNRDAERVADIATIQLALSLYHNKTSSYPDTLDDLSSQYLPADATIPPQSDEVYEYVPLNRTAGGKCTYYHLGIDLELPSAQIDQADNFNSLRTNPPISNNYRYCDFQNFNYTGPGINGIYDLEANPFMYDVHP